VNARNFFAELKLRNVYKLAISFMPCGKASLLFKVASMLVCFDHIARRIVNANRRITVFGPSH
jgi:hypothetical protein